MQGGNSRHCSLARGGMKRASRDATRRARMLLRGTREPFVFPGMRNARELPLVVHSLMQRGSDTSSQLPASLNAYIKFARALNKLGYSPIWHSSFLRWYRRLTNAPRPPAIDCSRRPLMTISYVKIRDECRMQATIKRRCRRRL